MGVVAAELVPEVSTPEEPAENPEVTRKIATPSKTTPTTIEGFRSSPTTWNVLPSRDGEDLSSKRGIDGVEDVSDTGELFLPLPSLDEVRLTLFVGEDNTGSSLSLSFDCPRDFSPPPDPFRFVLLVTFVVTPFKRSFNDPHVRFFPDFSLAEPASSGSDSARSSSSLSSSAIASSSIGPSAEDGVGERGGE